MAQVSGGIVQLRSVEAMTTLVQEMIDAPIGQHRMGCYHGPSGAGKTFATAVCEVAYNALVVEVIENTSKLDFLTSITEAYDIPARRDAASQIRAIASFLDGEQVPLIIDDAQYLVKRNMIGMARDIYNLAGSIVPVILVGEPKLYDHLRGTANIYNRVTGRVQAPPCNMADATRLAQVYAPGVDIDPVLMTEIVQQANGSVARVSGMLGTVRNAAQAQGVVSFSREDWGKRPFMNGDMIPVNAEPRSSARVELMATRSVG
ncbi:ATP-binding protein [uncultured Tateyamaria sp.]|uniref:ATP-binding protein n=1 Tax=uncultured Tateyamaria sp. TaxID=455651 RepID=UPI002637AAE5|nr:ATP-binding protein [uncultured Tateyamaria sp.]